MNAETKLLVVDDEAIVCESCSRIFEKQGFGVDTSTDSQEGLKMATETAYSAILVDMKMPGLDGIQFLEALRTNRPDVPVIIITGHASIPSAAAAMRLGASDYIAKPFTPEEIIASVRRTAFAPSADTRVPAPAAKAAAAPARPKVQPAPKPALKPARVAVPAPQPASSQSLPTGISRLRLTNRVGQVVSLIAEEGLLSNAQGIGHSLIQTLLNQNYPLATDLGATRPTPASILKECAESDKVILLGARNLGLAPGSIAQSKWSDNAGLLGELAEKVTIFSIQPAAGSSSALGYDAKTQASVLQQILGEMI